MILRLRGASAESAVLKEICWGGPASPSAAGPFGIAQEWSPKSWTSPGSLENTNTHSRVDHRETVLSGLICKTGLAYTQKGNHAAQ